MQWFRGAKYPQHKDTNTPEDDQANYAAYDQALDEKLSQTQDIRDAANREIDLLEQTIEDLRIEDITEDKLNNGG